ncbi:GNAT family N-acetyltransferase [Paracoccus sp. (in: a-proteobacteria)]|uniref:GNAT family N-acetyltransferase n=1 Tax=Paracoccus sp. TaxID=267 RepID=UPI00289B6A3E|nr:GNAT family N-acetyltransferase [Paracoccus sp. (in: a-proteobacteria)]
MSDFVFAQEERDARHGRFTARLADHDGEAEITYTRRGPNRISADHTGSPDSLRGTGAAAALVAHMVSLARSEGFTIIPICPYVRAQYQRHPEWQDVMSVAPGEDVTI